MIKRLLFSFLTIVFISANNSYSQKTAIPLNNSVSIDGIIIFGLDENQSFITNGKMGLMLNYSRVVIKKICTF